jgi:hypothetical protein
MNSFKPFMLAFGLKLGARWDRFGALFSRSLSSISTMLPPTASHVGYEVRSLFSYV